MTALLALDFETNDLDVNTLTVLEVAWCVIDMDGTQRLPLRHRYCGFTTAERPQVPQIHNPIGRFWDQTGGGSRVARDMAVESGLFDDWLAADPRLRLDSGVDLQRLLLDDLAEVCDADEYVHVHGAGAARFDYSILALHCPRVIPAPGERFPVHYRPVDTSGMQTGLMGNNHEAEMIAWARGKYGPELDWVEVGRPPHYNFAGPLIDGSQHRAAVDVARAIVVQRALWRFAEPLRAEIAALAGGKA